MRTPIYDRLLATLSDSHTFRVPAGRLPEAAGGPPGCASARRATAIAVKGVVPGSAAERGGLSTRRPDPSRSTARPYGKEPRQLPRPLLRLRGRARLDRRGHAAAAGRARAQHGSASSLRAARGGRATPWSGRARASIRKDGKAYGYAHLWGMCADDGARDRRHAARPRRGAEGSRPELGGLARRSTVSCSTCAATAAATTRTSCRRSCAGQWSAGDYYVISRDAKRLVPPVYKPLPVALLVNSGTARTPRPSP